MLILRERHLRLLLLGGERTLRWLVQLVPPKWRMLAVDVCVRSGATVVRTGRGCEQNLPLRLLLALVREDTCLTRVLVLEGSIVRLIEGLVLLHSLSREYHIYLLQI